MNTGSERKNNGKWRARVEWNAQMECVGITLQRLDGDTEPALTVDPVVIDVRDFEFTVRRENETGAAGIDLRIDGGLVSPFGPETTVLVENTTEV